MAAKIPTLLSIEKRQQQKQLHRPQYQQRWGWRDGHRPKLSPSEESDFIRTYAWPKETELVRRAAFGTYERAHEIQTVSALMIVLGTAMSL